MTGDFTLATDYACAEIAAHLRAGRHDRAVLEAERLAGLVRQPGLRALLTDLAAAIVPPAQAKRDGEA